jgi:ATP/maltotriose-dependent transcriptional regulator MalT/DNA-binding SARP family transcriptional activator
LTGRTCACEDRSEPRREGNLAQEKRRGVAFAKTTRPIIGGAVRREPLFARLDGAPGRTLAWISGPPGAGKSTLAASYLEARSLAGIWYQLDPDDADVATFFHYLRHAARRFAGTRARELPAFTQQYNADVQSFARRFFRQLFGGAQAPAALVLDNLHEIAADSPLHAALEAGVSQVPGGCCIIVVSRAEPPAAFARLRLAGGMVHVGWEDLRIGPQEVAGIASLRGQSLSPDAAARLHERAQGWAAGLVLMLEHAKVSGRIAEVPGEAAPGVVFDYLAGEIFDRFEKRTQHFLLKIACLQRMSAEVAETLSGEAGAERLLANLARNDWFVREVQDEDERVYQLHPLLRDFLRNRAGQEPPDAAAGGRLKKAAELLRSTGNPEDAVSLLAECREWSEIARIAAEEADGMLAEGRSQTLSGWLDLLPAPLIDADPRVLRARAASSLPASPRTARRLYAQAYESSRIAGDPTAMIQCCRGVIDAIVLEFDDLAALDEWIAALAGLLERGAARPAAGLDPAAVSTLIRALILRDFGHDGLERWLAYAHRAIRSPGDESIHPAILAELALAHAAAGLMRGDLAAAEATLATLQSIPGERFPGAAMAIGLTSSLRQLLDGAHAAALASAREALSLAAAEGLHEYDEWLHVAAAAAALGADDRVAAREELAALEAAGARQGRGDRAFLHHLRGWLALAEADTAGASREARLAVADAVDAGIPWLECLTRIAWAQLLSGVGDRRGAEAQIRSAEALARGARAPLLEAAVQLTLAGAALKAGDTAAVIDPLRAGLAFAREHGLRHIPGVRAPLLAELCAAALREGVEREFAGALVRSGRLAPPAAALRLKDWPRPFQICTLGGFRLARDSAPMEFAARGPGRPVELLKVLVALGGRNVRAEQLGDALWPQADADYAHKSFTATLHRLRRMLEEEDALVLRDGRLTLSPGHFWVDTWALDDLAGELDNALRDPRPGAAAALRACADEMLALYRGPFLPDESDQPSYLACREQLRAKLLRCLGRAARRWEEAGEHATAVDSYLRCIDADELCEAFYRELMLCHQRRGERAEALSAYERLRAALSARLKVMPSPETQAVYAGLLAQQSSMQPPMNADGRR